MVETKGLSGLFGQFTRGFWIVNTLELFERGAYYSLMAILAAHMVQNLAISYTITGVISAVFMFCLYFLPFIMGAIADKVGFKKMLIFNFILMFIGYSLIGIVDNTTLFVISIVILGVGAGGFKPIISSTIAYLTKTEQRNLAYSIYYWMINCGAFIFPLLWGLYYTRFPSQDAAAPFYYYVFFFSAFFVIVNIIFTLFYYRNPKEPESDKKVKTVFANAAMVVKDFKFFSLLIIYSGFWFMFAMNHTFLPLYMLNFQIMPNWFTTLLLATINPGTIIVVGPYLARFAEKLPSLQMMIIGICIFMVGLLILGFSQTPAALFTGIIVFSIGEFLTHPNFISYVSKIAPKDRVTIYMGYIFIATGIGLVLGSLFGGSLYENIAKNMESPKLFWSIVVSVGLLSAFFLIFYNKRYSEKKTVMDEEEEVFEEREIIPEKKGILDMNITLVLPLLMIPILLMIAKGAGTNTFHELSTGEETGELKVINWAEDYDEGWGDMITEGSSNEMSDTDVRFELPRDDINNIKSVRFELTWTDETPDNTYRYTNEADEFQLIVEPPEDAESIESAIEYGGSVSLVYDPLGGQPAPNRDPYYNGTGEYLIIVRCHDCGDQVLRRPSSGYFDIPDTGNDWSLEVTYTYWNKIEST